MSHRPHRVADLLRAELSMIMRRDLSDPRLNLVSISSVDVSPDLRRARVKVSALGDDDSRQAGLEALTHAKGFIRSRLAKNLRNLRVLPDLDFELDHGPEHSQHISELLEGLHDDDHERS